MQAIQLFVCALQTVEPPSLISDVPQTVRSKQGENLTLRVHAKGTDLSYQWMKNGSLIDSKQNYYRGMKTPILAIDEASLEHSGEYCCMIENEVKSLTSSICTVTIG